MQNIQLQGEHLCPLPTRKQKQHAHQVKSSNVVGVIEATAWEGDIQVEAPACPFPYVINVPCARVEPIAPAQQTHECISSP